MYFLNVNGMIKDLRYGTLDEKESAKYLVGTLILESTSVLSMNKGEQMPLSLRVLTFVVTALIIFFGVKACYRANQEGGDKDFLKRFYCLAFPIGIWLMIILTTLMFLFSFLTYFITIGEPTENFMRITYITALVLAFSITMAKFYWIRKSLQKLAKI